MKLDWYNFGESALLGISYSPYEAKMSLIIDARITIGNPKSQAVQGYADYFEEIQIVFDGVTCCGFVRNPNMLSNGEDLGDIELLTVYTNPMELASKSWFHELSYDYIKGKAHLHGVKSPIAKQYCEFISDSLVVGHGRIGISGHQDPSAR